MVLPTATAWKLTISFWKSITNKTKRHYMYFYCHKIRLQRRFFSAPPRHKPVLMTPDLLLSPWVNLLSMELRGNLRFFLLRHYCQREIRSVGETCRYISVVPYLASGCADKVLMPATFPIFPSFQPRCFSSNCVNLKLDIANNRFPVLVYKIHYISKKTYRKLNCEVKRVC